MRRLTDTELTILKRINLYGYLSVQSMSEEELNAAQTLYRDLGALGGDLDSFCVNRNTVHVIKSEEERRQQDRDHKENQIRLQQDLDDMNRLAQMNKKSDKKRELIIMILIAPLIAKFVEDLYTLTKELVAYLIERFC